MFDIIASFGFTAEDIRQATELASALSAILIGFMAFAVTPDAGIHCPQAFLRLVHRILLVGFAIACAYNAAYIIATKSTPLGPSLLMFTMLFVSALISTIRFLNVPGVPKENRWPWHTPSHQHLEDN